MNKYQCKTDNTPIDPKTAREKLDCLAREREVEEFKIKILKLFMFACSFVVTGIIIFSIYSLFQYLVKLNG